MSSDRNIKNTPYNENSCDVTAFQEIDVCVPITVEPYVDLGEPIIDCIEEPCLVPIPCGSWNKKGKCKFYISQKLSIMIPIEFKAETCSGAASIRCLEQEAEEEDCSPNICCETLQRPTFVCCEEEHTPEIPNFYYYVRGKTGRIKK